MRIRPYAESDRTSCLALIDENTPEFFLPEDRAAFDDFLAELPGPYFVGVEGARVVACGGWALDADGVAALTWGIVSRAMHRRGLGRSLLRFRLDDVMAHTPASMARVRTIQLVQQFFEKEGFVAIDVVPDGYGPGLDKVTMERRLPSHDRPAGVAGGHSSRGDNVDASESHNLQLVRDYLAALAAGESGAPLARFFTPDAVQEEFPNRLNPNGGRSDLATMLVRSEQGKRLLASQQYVVRSAIARGPTVAVEAEWRATLTTPVPGLPASGEMQAKFAMFFEFVDGKIHRQRNYDCFDPW